MAYFKEEVLNEIRSKADIVDIISSYLEVRPKGKNFVAVCPFHDDHSPSLTISREKQIFNCFTCRTGGNVFTFVMKYENVSFVEAVKIIADKVGVRLEGMSNISYEGKFKNELEVMDYAMKYYKNNLATSNGFKAREYLANRGIDEKIVKEFNIGLSGSNYDDFYNLCLKKGYSLDLLDNLGLVRKVDEKVYDSFVGRIMIPIENLKGQVVGFTGRIYNGEENTAKYINTKDTPIFKKGDILFNYHNARNYIREKKSLIVVEGNMDAISLSARGIKNVVALMGLVISDKHIEMFKKLSVPIILMLDNDNAGLEATVKNGDILVRCGIDTRVVRLSDAKDPDEYIRLKGLDDLKNNINHAIKYLDFKLEYLKKDKNLNNTDDVINYVKEVIESINGLDNLSQEVIISKLSKDYNLDIGIIKGQLSNNKERTEVKKEKVIKHNNKLSKYEKASHIILYYMLMDSKYINLYKNRLGYFKEYKERELASEIIYYNKNHQGIDVADFTTTMVENNNYDFLESILSMNIVNLNEDEFNSCIKVILDIYKNDEINELKVQIKNELDDSKRMKLVEKFRMLKKGSVE